MQVMTMQQIEDRILEINNEVEEMSYRRSRLESEFRKLSDLLDQMEELENEQ